MSTIKTNKFQTLDGLTYSVPIQVITSSLGAADLGTTDTSTSDRTNNNPAWALRSTTTTWTDTPNLQLTITPKFQTSIIRLELTVTLSTDASANAAGLRVRRGNKIVFRPAVNTTGPYGLGYSGSGGNLWSQYNVVFYDTPSTTSPVTYTLQYRTYNGGTCHWFGYVTGDWAPANWFTATEYAQ